MNTVVNLFNNKQVKEFDALIIGGGGSGMRTSLELARSGLKTAVISKVFPTRSHTVLLKVELHVRFRVQIPMMIGDGICMTQ